MKHSEEFEKNWVRQKYRFFYHAAKSAPVGSQNFGKGAGIYSIRQTSECCLPNLDLETRYFENIGNRIDVCNDNKT